METDVASLEERTLLDVLQGSNLDAVVVLATVVCMARTSSLPLELTIVTL